MAKKLREVSKDAPLDRIGLKIYLRSRATVSVFYTFTSLIQGDEENGTRYTLLFTISNSWPISFGKDSF